MKINKLYVQQVRAVQYRSASEEPVPRARRVAGGHIDGEQVPEVPQHWVPGGQVGAAAQLVTVVNS